MTDYFLQYRPGSSSAPSGAAGGDLTGTYPNPTLATISGNANLTGSIKIEGATTASGFIRTKNYASATDFWRGINSGGEAIILRQAGAALVFGDSNAVSGWSTSLNGYDLVINSRSSATWYAPLITFNEFSSTKQRVKIDTGTGVGLSYFGGAAADGVYCTAIGPMPSFTTSKSGIWFLANSGVAPTSSNVAVYGNGSQTIINVPVTGSYVGFLDNGATYMGTWSISDLNMLSTSMTFGATSSSATDGLVRFPNNKFIQGRNAANSANYVLLGVDISNYWTAGNTTAGIQFAMAGDDLIISGGSAQVVRTSSTTWNMTPVLSWTTSATATITQADKTTNSGTGSTMTIQAQNETGTTSTGGALNLSGGTGTSAYGTAQVLSPLGGGYLAYTFASDANQTLTAAQSANNILVINSGVTSTGRTITLSRPAADKSLIFVKNNNAQTITIAFATGTGVTVATATSALITTDGTNAVKIMAGT